MDSYENQLAAWLPGYINGRINETKQGELRRFACDQKLPPAVAQWLLYCAADLVEFEQYGKDALQTTAQRIDALRSVAALAEQLNKAMQTLNLADRMPLLQLGSLRGGVGIPSPAQLATLNQCAKDFADHWDAVLKSKHKRPGGRKPTLTRHAAVVGKLATVLGHFGFKLGRNKKFLTIAEAVWTAAGLDSPDEAIRKFSVLKKDPLHQSHWYVLTPELWQEIKAQPAQGAACTRTMRDFLGFFFAESPVT